MLTTANEMVNTGIVTAKSVTGICSPSTERTHRLSFLGGFFVSTLHGHALFGRIIWGAERLAGLGAGLQTRMVCPFLFAGKGHLKPFHRGAIS